EVVALGEAQASMRRGDGRVVSLDLGGSRYSTTELLSIEEALLASAEARRDEGCAVVEGTDLQAALDARPGLAPEQVRVVASLTTSGHGVEVVAAAAGTGKTFSLDAARDAWARSGQRVVGSALAARAAAELQAGSGVRSATITRLLGDLDAGEVLVAHSVLVVDEAGMVGTRTLVRLADHAAR